MSNEIKELDVYQIILDDSVFIKKNPTPNPPNPPPPTQQNKQINKLVACQRYSPFSSVMRGTPWINRYNLRRTCQIEVFFFLNNDNYLYSYGEKNPQ